MSKLREACQHARDAFGAIRDGLGWDNLREGAKKMCTVLDSALLDDALNEPTRMTPRELATALAALRFWQVETQKYGVAEMRLAFQEFFDADDSLFPLSAQEIAALCKRLTLRDDEENGLRPRRRSRFPVV